MASVAAELARKLTAPDRHASHGLPDIQHHVFSTQLGNVVPPCTCPEDPAKVGTKLTQDVRPTVGNHATNDRLGKAPDHVKSALWRAENASVHAGCQPQWPLIRVTVPLRKQELPLSPGTVYRRCGGSVTRIKSRVGDSALHGLEVPEVLDEVL